MAVRWCVDPVSAALFDLASYPGEIVSDLFGDERYFADAHAFWTAQNAAIEERAGAYREVGWSEVVILPTGEPFQAYEHERTPKRKGGKVFISIGNPGTGLETGTSGSVPPSARRFR